MASDAADSADVVVLGGGFSGLSCAAALADAGLRVTVLEKKPHLGGRAFSFRDADSGSIVDNGQHLFMGCYRQTRAFLRRIGTEGLLPLSRRLSVDFADVTGARDRLSCPNLPPPLHLAVGVLRLKGLSLRDKAGLLRLDRCLRALGRAALPEAVDRLTVRQWLDSLRLSRRVQERLLEPLSLGILNEQPDTAAATGFVQALREIFYGDLEGSRLALARVGLSELYTDAARRFVEARGGRVATSAKVAGLEARQGAVAFVRLESGSPVAARRVVSTLAPWDLARLELPAQAAGRWKGLRAAPIVSVCLWLDRKALAEPMLGLLGTQTQWAFDKSRILRESSSGQYLSLVISGAHRQIGWSPAVLALAAERDLALCLPGLKMATIRRWKVVKEPFATLSPTPGSEALRPPPGLAMPGLYLAGDWTRTGLPATIESAVASGHRVAESIIREKSYVEA